MDIDASTTPTPDLEHPEDAEYIWLPILVLVGVILLAGLVYAMSRIRRPFNCFHFKRRNATRNGYVSVDEGDSDVSMAGGDDFEEPNPSLLDARLHISTRPHNICHSSHIQTNSDDIALIA